MKIICPFCGAELDSKNDVPTVVQTAVGGTYICHKVICSNKSGHPDKNKITVVFKEK